MPKLHEFTVEGPGTFPVDMLRYDQCWPRREAEDTPKILGTPDRPANPTVAEKAQEIIRLMQGKPDLMREVLRQLMDLQDDNLFKGVRRVTLVGVHKPTAARWESFGWKVVGG